MSTLQEKLDIWRPHLDDAVEPYLWEPGELAEYANKIINKLCREIPLISDSTDADICKVDVVAGTAVYTVSHIINGFSRAKLATHTKPIDRTTVKWMDQNRNDWENQGQGEPTLLITRGVGTNKIRLWPTPAADDTLWLSVWRLPKVPLSAGTLDGAPEISAAFHDLIDNGVYWLAYGKQDIDTFDVKKADYYRALFMEDKEEIKNSVKEWHDVDRMTTANEAFL